MASHLLTGHAHEIELSSGSLLTIAGVRGTLQVDAPLPGARAFTSPDSLAAALERAELVEQQTVRIVAEPEVAPAGETSRGARGARDIVVVEEPVASLEIEHAAGEGVLVLRQDEYGGLSWHLPEQAAEPATRALGAGSTRSTVRVPLPAHAPAAGARGFGGVVGKVLKVFVYPITDFVIGAAARPAVRAWEASHRPYRVRSYTPDDYQQDPGFPALTGAGWRTMASGRALLFVHGTFSSCGAFRALPSAVMQDLASRYGNRLLAFDHPSLGEDPGQNADWFLDQLAGAGLSLDVDIICHSRGGLVARELAERGRSRGLRVGRIVLVGAVDAGTTLADADHMVGMIDRFTTIANYLPAGGVASAIDAAIAGLKIIAHAGLSGLPGLEAMNPRSEYLATLTRTAAAGPELFGIGSDYEPAADSPLFSFRRATDATIDTVFGRAPNDLVVPREGVFVVAGAAGFPIDDARRLVFAPADGVIHTEYFSHPRTQQQLVTWLGASATGTRTLAGARAMEPSELNALRSHVITMRDGALARTGLLPTSEADVEAIFTRALPAWAAQHPHAAPLRIAVWAHGGLINEAEGLQIAQKHVEWWKRNGVYPLYFIWETGLFDALGSILASASHASRSIQGRGLSDFGDVVVEKVARMLHGDRIWGAMKDNAARCSADGGAAQRVAERLARFCAEHEGAVELHAVGHSAGSIFHSHWIPATAAAGVPPFVTTQLLAPAIRVDEFKARLAPAIAAQAGTLTLYTMQDSFEQADTCMSVYHKSLLYLIYRALERDADTPVLGMSIALHNDPELRALFGLGSAGGRAEVVWSRTTETAGRGASTSTSHGGFDDDACTMNSVACRVLNADAPRAPYAGDARGSRSWPLAFEGVAVPAPVAMTMVSTSNEAIEVAVTGHSTVTPSRGGRRLALCVGVDAYPSPNALAGCVNDARLWMRTLQDTLHFERVDTLTDDKATRGNIIAALRTMVDTATAGDVLVFQFAGHGTSLPDDDGDEEDGTDEALVPVDFGEGEFLIDDDLRAIFTTLKPGVALTCFIDCCHSATTTRMLGVGTAIPAGSRARRIVLAADDPRVEEHLARRQRGEERALRTPAVVDATQLRWVNFSACQATELALESAGNGDFTRHAIAILRNGIAGISNAELQRRIVEAFGTARRQTPDLDCAPAARDFQLLASLAGVDQPDRRGLASDRRSLPEARDSFDRRDAHLGRRGTEAERVASVATVEQLRALADRIEQGVEQ